MSANGDMSGSRSRSLPRFTSYMESSQQKIMERIGSRATAHAKSGTGFNFATLAKMRAKATAGGGTIAAHFQSPPRHQVGRDGLSPLREMIRKL